MATHPKSLVKPACRGICTVVALLLACGTLIGKPGDTAYLKAKVDPGRAGVFVDGKYLGPAANFKVARKYALPPGQHEVKLVDPRYEEVTTTVTLEAGKTTVVAQTLKPLPPPKKPLGMLKTAVTTNKFDAVFLNDKFYGHTGEFNGCGQGLMLPPGEYTVKIEPVSGGSPITKKVQIEAGKTVVVP
ncbi:MAG: PEGA domain-containing protein [Bryobacteraceae bacterium]|jgi:hypothetical protein